MSLGGSMRKVLGLFLGIYLSIHSGFAHNGNRVDIEADLTTAKAGQILYTFQLIDEKLRKPVSASELAITHERKLHMLVFDAGLKEFIHEHPEYNEKDGVWSVSLSINTSGTYKVWMQGELTSGDEFTTGEELKVTDGKPANAVPTSLDPSNKGAEGNSAVELSYRGLKANKMAMIDMIFSRTDGSKLELTPFLGAIAHVVATPLDGKSLIHVHPMDGHEPHKGMIHAMFPKAGDYRLWVQFVDAGNMRVIPLSVRVSP
jgi:hypothetical protein